MSGVDLVTFLRARLDEREAWARGASRPYRYADEGSTAPAEGVHWRWVAGEHWETVTPDPVGSEFVAEPGHSCNLVTVEEWPTSSLAGDGTPIRTRMMPLAYADSIVEMDSAAAGHIALNDPAYVLADVAAKRRIVGQWMDVSARRLYYERDGEEPFASEARGQAEMLERVIRLLAASFAQHPDYDPAWAVEA